MNDLMIWEPVRAANDDSGGGNGRSSRGGRRSSSIIARRRPATKKDAAAESKGDASDKAEQVKAEEKPKTEEKKAPRRRRRTPAKAAASKPPAAEVEAVADEADESDDIEAAEDAGDTDVEEAPAALVKTTPKPDSAGVASGDLRDLRKLVEEQGRTLTELRAGLLTLGEQLDLSAQRPRLGVFVDVPNVMYGQEPDEKPVDMGKLLNMLRKGRDLVRATAYSPVSDDPSEPLEQQKFVAPFVPYEYRIVTKPLKRFADGSIKGNFDVEMAIDMLTMAERLDIIAIVSGDADFARAVEVVQTRGVRVEVVAFAGSTSLEMRSLADRYIELGQVVDRLT